MQAQVERTKGELILELHGKIITTSVKEISQNGIKLEVNDEGQITGKYNANGTATQIVNIKPDGTFDWETKAIETTREGDMAVNWGGGKGRSTGPGASSWEGEVHYMSQSPRLSWLNNTTAFVEGTTNMATREIQAKIYAKK